MKKSKSAYSEPSKIGKNEHHIIVVWVDNEAGVLARVVGLFSGRGYNIDSLAVAEVDKKKHLSRITIVTIGTPEVIEQIKLQLKKLIPVHKVADFSRHDPNILFKELALFKIPLLFDLLYSQRVFQKPEIDKRLHNPPQCLNDLGAQLPA